MLRREINRPPDVVNTQEATNRPRFEADSFRGAVSFPHFLHLLTPSPSESTKISKRLPASSRKKPGRTPTSAALDVDADGRKVWDTPKKTAQKERLGLLYSTCSRRAKQRGGKAHLLLYASTQKFCIFTEVQVGCAQGRTSSSRPLAARPTNALHPVVVHRPLGLKNGLKSAWGRSHPPQAVISSLHGGKRPPERPQRWNFRPPSLGRTDGDRQILIDCLLEHGAGGADIPVLGPFVGPFPFVETASSSCLSSITAPVPGSTVPIIRRSRTAGGTPCW